MNAELDKDVQAEIDRLTEIEIQKMARAELVRNQTNTGVNQRQGEQHVQQQS